MLSLRVSSGVFSSARLQPSSDTGIASVLAKRRISGRELAHLDWETKMAHSEFAAEVTPLASEPRLRCASESSTKRTTDAASETAHHASLDSRSLYDRIARPFCKQWLQKEIAH